MPTAKIATIDFGPFMEGPGPDDTDFPTEAQTKVAAQIDEAFRDVGFIFLTNFGLPKDLHDDMYQIAKDMFLQPRHVKESVLPRITRPKHVGYFPYSTETLNRARPPDLKEAFNFKFRQSYDQDFTGCPPKLRKRGEQFWDVITTANEKLSAACALALKLPPRFFLDLMRSNDSTAFRLLHYPPCEVSLGDKLDESMRCSEHTDFDYITILFTDGAGLQVQPVHGGMLHGTTGGSDSWQDVDVPGGNTAVVNVGGLLARATNDIWRAGAHRVIVPSLEDAARHRFTIVAFFVPDSNVITYVHPSLTDGKNPKYDPISTVEYFRMRLADNGDEVTF